MQLMPEPLSAERARIERIVFRLHEADDTTERADLAAELVRAVARYEDMMERAVLPRLEGVVAHDELENQARRREELRAAMTVIHDRTMHIDPRNVHVSDPDSLEAALDEVLRGVEEQLPAEERAMKQLLDGMPDAARHELAQAVGSAARRASERPRPPRTKLGRWAANAHVKLDHSIEDVSTPQHPGADVVDGRTGEG